MPFFGREPVAGVKEQDTRQEPRRRKEKVIMKYTLEQIYEALDKIEDGQMMKADLQDTRERRRNTISQRLRQERRHPAQG